ncbi:MULTISPECIES: carboxylesterase family protein [Vibrio]|uniref:carboxylesterase family protein n=1 Tax=Vibrio TaxID=662 RepID=UPI001BD3D742|nr:MULTISPECIES: carboxylesterase family protein [Vibrio]ELA9459971.1 carboxylesterase family protein [Vibrio alginolyticus]MBS9847383.1 carboxylesterase family protein [Vibrio alginolyticus]MCG9743677.1 carboxylesterase family protein [Vibrio alginolyticus]MDW1636550.1 carboxylesterase family protein [Vibrio sp. Vb2907]MDW1707303.1 carboxylesterase family protein [Vibrio sp. Vb2917]
MTLLNRSTLAITITLALAACSDDSGKPSVPNGPKPLQPLPPEQIALEIGDATIQATKESLVITPLDADEKLAAVEAFKGIQFAQADRFQHSIAVPLEGDIDATQFGDACPQLKTTTQTQSENCLNLNIWRPAGTEAYADLPVYVFIHGGDFEYGAGSEPLIHGDMVVAQGADDGNPFIAVTFNYRLGLLGSVWVDGLDNPEGGNFGLGDQKHALEWVQQNIETFGGNPKNVTLMGQGAGAMSVGILQQSKGDAAIAGEHFQRAIMQSNAYGFEYKSYDVAKSQRPEQSVEDLALLPLEEVMKVQSEMLDPIQRLKNWVLTAVNIPVISPTRDNSPLATLMPFAPYIEHRPPAFLVKEVPGYHFTEQAIESEWIVPTVIGSNSAEINTLGMLPSLTFLIPTIIEILSQEAPEIIESGDETLIVEYMVEWLESETNLNRLRTEYRSLLSDSASIELDLSDLLELLPCTAYEAMTKLFFGLGNSDSTTELLALADFFPNDESELNGASKNMQQFKTALHDLLFTGPNRHKVSTEEATGATPSFYYFDYTPGFNVWTYNTKGENGDLDVGDLLKSISCIVGACNASELPFVFNKALKLDGSSVRPGSKDKAMMNELSRMWFSERLFEDFQYNSTTDRVLLIDNDGGIQSTQDWDNAHHSGIDPKLRQGRLNGLEELGLILSHM